MLLSELVQSMHLGHRQLMAQSRELQWQNVPVQCVSSQLVVPWLDVDVNACPTTA